MSSKPLIVCALFIACLGCTTDSSTGEARNGVMDLTAYDFRSGRLVELKGEWQIFWDQFLLPGDSAIHPPLLIDVPRRWNDLPWAGGILPVYGKATYQIILKLNPRTIEEPGQGTAMGLALKDIHSAYRLFINGNHYFDKGNVNEKPGYKPRLGHETVYFEVDTPTIVITIQVANYSDPRQGGMDESILLGSAQQIRKNALSNNFLYTLSFGILSILFFYHLILFLFRRKDTVNLYFSLLCLLLAWASVCMGSKIICFILPQLNAGLYIRIFMASLLSLAFVFLYYNKLLPHEFPAKLVRVVIWFYGIMTAYYLIQPFTLVWISDFYYATTLILFIYVFVAQIVAIVKRRKHAVIIFAGTAIAILTGINDMLHALEIIYTGYYTSIGFIVYTFSQSTLLSYKFSQSFGNVEKLSGELEQMNQQLEVLVEKRTHELDLANQDLTRANATKDRFLSIIAHDLKGPIGTTSSLLELVVSQDSDLEEVKRSEILDKINQSTGNTYKLLENLLTWARSNQGDIAFEPAFVNIGGIIRQVETLLTGSAQRKGITLHVEADPDLTVFCDSNMIQTVVRNLVSNAIKFSRPGGIVNIKTSSDTDDQVIVSVEDQGVGMTEEIIRRLFRIEEKIAVKGTGGETGTGLGLIISQDFLSRHRTQLRVTSQENRGSTFSFTLARRDIFTGNSENS